MTRWRLMLSMDMDSVQKEGDLGRVVQMAVGYPNRNSRQIVRDARSEW